MTQKIIIPNNSVALSIRREDLIHPFVSGNKFRKLKYNLLQAEKLQLKTLLTFGGAFSNHIAAVAAAGKSFGYQTIGVVRGDELQNRIEENPTLSFAIQQGMKLVFVSREEYRKKDSAEFLQQLRERYGPFYLLPEGGTNALAVQGCEEILSAADSVFDYICCAVGTGGTLSGIINSSSDNQAVLGFPALKADLRSAVQKFAKKDNWTLITGYHFGGYARVDAELVSFINEFYQQNAVLLDPVYTGKMIFGVMDLIRNGYFPEESKILAVHTGGIQGIQGMNNKLRNRNLPLIETK
ncbi:MAG TPA: pyridoxal-phosphate dependent enzyme [Flavobacterium sp.]